MKAKIKEEEKMLTFVFSIFMIAFIFEIIAVALKLTWGILKVIATIVGVVIIGALLFGAGLYVLAFVGLILAGIIGLITAAVA